MKMLVTLMVAVLLAFSWIGASVAARAPKVEVCHLEGNGSYHKISVNENSLPAHLAHGDGLPASDPEASDGGPVPGSGSFTGEGIFSAIGGNTDISLGGVGATFTSECTADGPATGTLYWSRVNFVNDWSADIVAGTVVFVGFDQVDFVARVTGSVGPNLGNCDLDMTIIGNSGVGSDNWILTDINTSPTAVFPDVCGVIGQNNNGTSTTGTFTVEAPF